MAKNINEAPNGWIYFATGGYGLLPLCKHEREWCQVEGLFLNLYTEYRNLGKEYIRNLTIDGRVAEEAGDAANSINHAGRQWFRAAEERGKEFVPLAWLHLEEDVRFIEDIGMEMASCEVCAVPSHTDPTAPEFGDTVEEVRQYVEEMRKHHNFLDPVAYFCTPEEYWEREAAEAEYELFKLRLPRGGLEIYFSFTGHFLAPVEEEGLRRLGRLAKRDQEFAEELEAAAQDGVNMTVVSTNESGIVHVTVSCPAGEWEESGFVYAATREDSSSCCAAQPHGGAWRFYLPASDQLRTAAKMACDYFHKRGGHPTARQCCKALDAVLSE